MGMFRKLNAFVRKIPFDNFFFTGGLVTFVISTSMGAVSYWNQKFVGRIRNSDWYTEAFSILERHKRAVNAIGPPIKRGAINTHDRKTNFVTPDAVKVCVPIFGEKDAGFVQIRALDLPESSDYATSNEKKSSGKRKRNLKVVKIDLELTGYDENVTIYEIDSLREEINAIDKNLNEVKNSKVVAKSAESSSSSQLKWISGAKI